MTQGAFSLWGEIIGVAGGALVLLLFGLTLAIPHRSGVRPGSRGHRQPEDQGVHEHIAPDGYIDSFARVIEEAGGSLPLVVRLAIPGVLIWWLLYLILNWTPR
jgi:hypothetical protein